ncbi:peptidase M28, partial [Saccharothrix sp. MB29]|nr:peptidase M28 [Saccharothrix sp. MB29]
YTTTFPRAYVIPVGAGQRTGAAAARLVDHLVAHDVRVVRAERPFTLAGRDHPAGSYVVDMHQPKRALANALLEAGRDISDRVDVMYDISGWSHGLLWGATVEAAVSGGLDVRGRPVAAARRRGRSRRPPGATWP